jgi:hypothetical protein
LSTFEKKDVANDVSWFAHLRKEGWETMFPDLLSFGKHGYKLAGLAIFGKHG